MSKKLVFGVGINDADYTIHKHIGSVWVGCPYYRRWYGVLKRCYDDYVHAKYPTYADCEVCEEWLTFSNFRKWMVEQDWENKELDKDILVKGNRVYSPTTCVFVHGLINTFLNDKSSSRGNLPLGVHAQKNTSRYKAQCGNPFTKKQEYLGYYDDPMEAHLAWKKRKHELACQLADSEYVTDERVAEVLRSRWC